jgi:subtilisin family serine protease
MGARWVIRLSALGWLVLATGQSAAGSLAAGDAATGAGPDDRERLYIVQLDGAPALAAPAVRRALGRDGFDPRHAAVRRHAAGLVTDHDSVLAAVGASAGKVYSYRYALNGFAARLTAAQARKLEGRADVRRVWEDRLKQTSTNASGSALGLNSRPGGLTGELGLTGDGVIIGVIDSGITPGHPSFSDTLEAPRPRLCRSGWSEQSLLGLWLCKRFRNRPDTLEFERPAGWTGACEAGPGFTSDSCNNKVIGARFYVDGFLGEYSLDGNEFLSPRDADGHGSHIASTAAGVTTRANIGGTRVDAIRGMAPRAWIAVYKACWLEPGALRGACSTADLTRAIEDAVADGVDIISYSLGSDDGITDPDDLALLAATEAGVLAVAAAGNEGPAPGSVVSPAAAPWTLAVGAATRSGDVFQTALAVNTPGTLSGRYPVIEAGFTPALASGATVTEDLVRADDGTAASFEDGGIGTTDDACEALVNGAELLGKVALVARGGCTFESKVQRAEAAGAVAVVVYNNLGAPIIMIGTRNAVGIPAVMVSRTDGDRLVQALDDGEAVEVTLQRGLLRTARDPARQLENLSARGPNFWVPDVLKPDVVAPGVNILGAHTPDAANNQRGELFQYLSGTSMAVPHVAGVAALLQQAHPDWSPAALHSALVTTADPDVRLADGTAASPFDVGGGYIRPNLAVAPGLVYERTTDDYDAFLCGAGEPRAGIDCASLLAGGRTGEARDLNLPAIAVNDLVSTATVRRRVTNVGAPATYVASGEAPAGISIEIAPSVLSLGTGETAEFTVTLQATDLAPLGAWQTGELTWTSGTTVVRSPVAVRAQPFAAEDFVAGSGATGSATIAVRSGYTGPYAPVLSGIDVSGQGQSGGIQAQLGNLFVADDGNLATGYQYVAPGGVLPGDVRRVPIAVPAGTQLLRIELRNEDTSGEHDLDLYAYNCPAYTVCLERDDLVPSVGPDSNEIIDLIDPPAGEYFIDVHGFATAGEGASFVLSVWTLGPARGNASLDAPANVLAGDSFNLTVNWQGLAPGRNLGLVTHRDATGDLAYTVVEVDALPAAP